MPRTCKRCGEERPLEQFQVTAHGKTDKSGSPYRLYICNTCKAERQRTQYHSDPKARAEQIVHAMNAQPRHKGQRVDVQAAVALLLNATRCHYCGQPNDGLLPFALDHCQPVALGGQNTLENLVPCCEPCNRAKHDMPADAYMTWLRGVAARSVSAAS